MGSDQMEDPDQMEDSAQMEDSDQMEDSAQFLPLGHSYPTFSCSISLQGVADRKRIPFLPQGYQSSIGKILHSGGPPQMVTFL